MITIASIVSLSSSTQLLASFFCANYNTTCANASVDTADSPAVDMYASHGVVVSSPLSLSSSHNTVAVLCCCAAVVVPLQVRYMCPSLHNSLCRYISVIVHLLLLLARINVLYASLHMRLFVPRRFICCCCYYCRGRDIVIRRTRRMSHIICINSACYTGNGTVVVISSSRRLLARVLGTQVLLLLLLLCRDR